MTKFSDLKLDPKVLKAVEEAGYESPTPIQEGAIPPALEGRDVLGIAQTGTGKTAGFVLPMITLLGRGRARARMPRSLVLCPTRELAAQVAENFDTYAKYTKLTKALLIGGVSFGEQDKLIDRGVDVLIATPGRLLDHFERGKLLLTGVQIMVVDEADRMLDMGFIPDIERIFQLTPFTRQTLFFSATMAPEIERITNTFLHAPVRIEVARQATASETITQRLVQLTPTRKDQTAKQKRALLRALIDAEGEGLKNAIIFCNRKTDVDIVAKSLARHGYDAAPIHGDLDQSHRTKTLDRFRDGSLKLLIASDVAARGLDIPAVSHVFNFDLPSHAEDYVHRIGRTGRAGRLGTAISIATPNDDKLLAAIEGLIKQSLPRAELPEGFSPTEDTTRSPRARDDRKDDRKGGRNSTRRREHRDDDQPQDSTPVSEPQSSRPQQNDVATPQDRPRAEAPKREERRQERRDERREERRPERKDDRRDNRSRGRGRDEQRGPAVVGMGDHVPQFMLVPLRMLSDSETPEDDAASGSAPAAESSETPKPKRSRARGKSRSNAAKVTDSDPQSEATTDQTEVKPVKVAADSTGPDSAAPAEAEADEPAPAKPRRSRRKKTDKPAAASTDAESDATKEAATEEAPKPKRSRARKPKAEVQSDTVGEEATKPRRSRRKKTDDVTATDAAPDANADEAPKPKRSRRKKVDTAEATPAAEATATSEESSNSDA